MQNKFDLVVIGSGPGGFVAAIRAAQLGLKVAIIERESLGGICLNWGCIPTKALLKSAEVYDLFKKAEEFGLKAEKFDFDFKKVVERSRKVASKLNSGVEYLMKKNKIQVIYGHGKLISNNKIEVTDNKNNKNTIEANNIIVATGARARTLPGFEPDNKLIWTYKEAMTPDIMPKSIIVVGSGAIGVEFASFYRSFGAEVTIIEVLDKILRNEDEEIAIMAHKSLEARGIKIMTSANLKEAKKLKDSLEVSIEHKGKTQIIKADRMIMSVGIVGNIENIGLEAVNVKTEKGQIVTDEYWQTSAKNIYAIGDVAGAPWLAHKAIHEAVHCVENIAGKAKHKLIRENIPACTFCTPQIASLGLTEKQAKEQGYDIKVGRFFAQANGKAKAIGEEEGLTKLIFDKKTGELLGAHMLGAEVTEMISALVMAKTCEATDEHLRLAILPHPTLSEMIHEAILDADNEAIHA